MDYLYISRMSKATIITARSKSSRLPNKILKYIKLNYKVIDVIISRAQKIGLPIIVATSSSRSDDKLVKYIMQKYKKINIYRGKLDNKVSRWFYCMKRFQINFACFIDGDDLAFDYNIFKKTMKLFNNNNATIFKYPKNVVTGIVTYCINYEALKVLYRNSKNKKKVEIIDKLILDKKIKKKIIKVPKILMNKKIRLTLDYKKDLIFFKKIYKEIDILAPSIKIVKYLLNNKKVADINFHLNEIWKFNQLNQIR